MTIHENLTIDSSIPIKQVNRIQSSWGLDRHADFFLEGILDCKEMNDGGIRDFRGSQIQIKHADDFLFCGEVSTTNIFVADGIFYLELKALSASAKLDQNVYGEMFQDIGATYRDIIRQMTEQASGNVICTIGDKAIEKPQLCYGETVWQFAKRMSYELHSHIMADVKTGRANFWFGLRCGKRIQEHTLFCKRIELDKTLTLPETRLSYLMEGTDNYNLGDILWYSGKWNVIYEREVYLDGGELVFLYRITEEKMLKSIPYSLDEIIGLSLCGTVEKIEKESVYVRLKLDKKKGKYPIPWYPETGTGWYAMPEVGAEVEITFMEANAESAAAVRCRDSKGTDSSKKQIKIPSGAAIQVETSRICLENKNRMNLSDRKLELIGNGDIEISARGKIALEGKTIDMRTDGMIACVTEY